MAKLSVEIADTPANLAHGLMHRTELGDNEGMLFKFYDLQEARFWGKNTYIPLDIAFVSGNTITSIKKITPMSTRLINSDGFCDMAIEANSGFFGKNNIKPGYKIKISDNTVEFECSE